MIPIVVTALHLASFLSLSLLATSTIVARKYTPKETAYIVTIAVASLLYLLVFAFFIISPTLGKTFDVLLQISGFLVFLYIVRTWNTAKGFIGKSGYFIVPLLMTGAFLIAFATINESCRTAFPTTEPNNQVFCYIDNLPIDNYLPYIYAKDVADGKPTALVGDWKLSDRPPLQVGTALSIGPLAAGSGYSYSIYTLVATFYQLSWIGALFGLLTIMRISLRNILTIICIIGLSGFVFINSVFVWPKLYAASLVIFGVTLLFFADKRINSRYLPVGLMAIALGLLTHTGVLFTVVGVAIVFAYYYFRSFGVNVHSKDFRQLVVGLVLACLLLGSWFAYKQAVNPIDRLTKYHFAGVTSGSDTRGTFETIIDQYHTLSARQWFDGRIKNAETLINPFGEYRAIRNPGESTVSYWARWIRQSNFFIFLASIGILNIGWVAFFRKQWIKQVSHSDIFTLAACGIGLLFWVLAMFVPGATINHQGSYAANLLIMALLGAFIARINGRLLPLLLAVQAGLFIFSWLFGGDYTVHQSKSERFVQLTILALLVFVIYQLPKSKVARDIK